MCRFIQYIVLYASFCAPYKQHDQNDQQHDKCQVGQRIEYLRIISAEACLNQGLRNGVYLETVHTGNIAGKRSYNIA